MGVHTGEFHCPICEEVFTLARDESDTDGIWTFNVVHDHSGDNPVWKANVYSPRRGRRLSQEEKDRREELHRQKQSLREEAAAKKRGVSANEAARTASYEAFLLDLRENGRDAVYRANRRAADREVH